MKNDLGCSDLGAVMNAAAVSAARLKPLHWPLRVRVDADKEGQPVAVHLLERRVVVESVLETWRIDDEWWRDRPVSRLYFRALLEDGRVVDVYRALASGRWFRQAY